MIYDSELMQDFLQLKQMTADNGGGAGTEAAAVGGAGTKGVAATPPEKQVDLRVMLPDHTVTSVTIKEFWRTAEVYQVGC